MSADPHALIEPGPIEGTVHGPPSKSHGIRLLAAACFSPGESLIQGAPTCDDFESALGVVQALGARIERVDGGIVVQGRAPEDHTPITLHCGESALCMRLFACLAATLPGPWRLEGEGSLNLRPMGGLERALRSLGAACTTQDGLPPVTVEGPLQGGSLRLDASSTSQIASGLLYALPLSPQGGVLELERPVSLGYLSMTWAVLSEFGLRIQADSTFRRFECPGGQRPVAGVHRVEADWSAAANYLVAGALAGSVRVTGLPSVSFQPDAIIEGILRSVGVTVLRDEEGLRVERSEARAFAVDVTGCPDLAPALAALATAASGTSRILGVHRLRTKECDRAEALRMELGKLGIEACIENDTLLVQGGRPRSARVSGHGDHRIVMALALVALRADGPVLIEGASAVAKSDPGFLWTLLRLQGRHS